VKQLLMIVGWFTSTVIFGVGLYSLTTNRRSVIHILISFELMYLSLSLLLITNSIVYHNYIAQLLALVILASVAAEAAVGLSLLVFRFNTRSNINVDSLSLLCG